MLKSVILIAFLAVASAKEYYDEIKSDVKEGLYQCAEDFYAEYSEYINEDEDPTEADVIAAEAALGECIYEVYLEYGEEAYSYLRSCIRDAVKSGDYSDEVEALEEDLDALEDTDDLTSEEVEELEEQVEEEEEALEEYAVSIVDQCIDKYYESTQTESETDDSEDSGDTTELFLQSAHRVFSA